MRLNRAVVIARTAAGRPARLVAAVITGLAAVGWLLDRLGIPTPLSTAADSLGTVSPFIALVLWTAAITVVVRRSSKQPA